MRTATHSERTKLPVPSEHEKVSEEIDGDCRAIGTRVMPALTDQPAADRVHMFSDSSVQVGEPCAEMLLIVYCDRVASIWTLGKVGFPQPPQRYYGGVAHDKRI